MSSPYANYAAAIDHVEAARNIIRDLGIGLDAEDKRVDANHMAVIRDDLNRVLDTMAATRACAARALTVGPYISMSDGNDWDGSWSRTKS